MPQRSQAHVRLSVIDNQYEDALVTLVGEGYADDVTLDDVMSVEMPMVMTLELTAAGSSKETNVVDDDVVGTAAAPHAPLGGRPGTTHAPLGGSTGHTTRPVANHIVSSQSQDTTHRQ